jgi:hypothetical protein
MKTEELLRYEAEFKAMREALGTSLLMFEFYNQVHSREKARKHHSLLRGFSLENHKRCPLNKTVSKGDEAKPDR